MIDYNFIRYKKLLPDALSQDESVEVEQNYLGAVQLKPNDNQSYNQVTNFDFNLVVSTYKASIVVLNGCKEYDVTPNVKINTIVSGEFKQGIFTYSDIPYDFGAELVYFKIDLHGNGVKFIYSNLIKITAQNIEQTVRLDFLDNTRKGIEDFKQ